MIKIKIRRSNGRITACEVTGHAGTDEKGKDIVCAAVSALTETALLGLGRCAGARLEYKVSRRPALLSFALKDAPNDKTDAILETMLLGLTEIAGTYKNSLELAEYRR
ncbi:MAG: ribosomal-processing cysteine protease Prp [Acidaminococcales bacterium]|jgi:uncharacterized protein YsxB (DUF464 family)|nr:ribosomal-processing cysteine protease Prp [Acidaminococcales bacterium]